MCRDTCCRTPGWLISRPDDFSCMTALLIAPLAEAVSQPRQPLAAKYTSRRPRFARRVKAWPASAAACNGDPYVTLPASSKFLGRCCTACTPAWPRHRSFGARTGTQVLARQPPASSTLHYSFPRLTCSTRSLPHTRRADGHLSICCARTFLALTAQRPPWQRGCTARGRPYWADTETAAGAAGPAAAHLRLMSSWTSWRRAPSTGHKVRSGRRGGQGRGRTPRLQRP